MKTDLKRNSHERQGTLLGQAPDDDSGPDYHFGLTITLEEPELQKFPVTADMVGKDLPLDVVARVVGYSDDDEYGKSARLQIRALGHADQQQDRTSVMYKDGEPS